MSRQSLGFGMQGLSCGLHQRSVVHDGHAATLAQQFQLGSYQGSNASSSALGIQIARFIMERKLVFLSMVAEQLARCFKEGTEQLDPVAQASTITHASESFGPGPSHQRQQDGFQLIVCMVSQQDMGQVLVPRDCLQGVVSGPPCCCGTGRRIKVLAVVGDAAVFTPTPHAHQFLFGFRTQVMLHRDRMQWSGVAMNRSMGQIEQSK